MKRYLPDTFTWMLLSTVLLATLLPATGRFEQVMHLASNTAIALLFFLHGARLSREAALSGFKQPRLHLLTLACKAGRADMLFQRGDTEHARIAQEQVLAARKRLLGAEHADTLRSKAALACTLLRMQELDAAGSLFDAVLQAQIRRLGPDHPETRKVREQLADVQMQLGGPVGGRIGEQALVPELHQDGAMDDYGDALSRPLRPRGVPSPGGLWTRAGDELLALDGHLSAARPPSR